MVREPLVSPMPFPSDSLHDPVGLGDYQTPEAIARNLTEPSPPDEERNVPDAVVLDLASLDQGTTLSPLTVAPIKVIKMWKLRVFIFHSKSQIHSITIPSTSDDKLGLSETRLQKTTRLKRDKLHA